MACSSNLTSGFVDLSTFDELEKYLYGGPDAKAYFVRETCKSTWFTQVPVVLNQSSGQTGFNQRWSSQITRAGDYMLNVWLRVTFPSVQLTPAAIAAGLTLRWSRNPMHNLISESTLTFNDLRAEQFDNYVLDFWAAFTVPAGKRNGYDNMIGNIDDLTQPHPLGAFPAAIPSVTLNLPLPFWMNRDTGIALPTASLPYNEMRINFCFRDYLQLLIVEDTTAVAGTDPCRAVTAADLVTVPVLTNVQTWANYALVSNEERERMGHGARDILIEQYQTSPVQNFAPATNPQPSFDIHFSHAIKALFWAVRNKTCAPNWSNYTTASPVIVGGVLDFTPPGTDDPITTTSLTYESTQRLSAMGSDYFSLVQPWFHAPVIPIETGYHLYSYALDFYCLNPQGSTNYGKLTNVSLAPVASALAITAANGTGAAGSGQDYVQTFDFIVVGVNYNIVRISGGAFGFPVL